MAREENTPSVFRQALPEAQRNAAIWKLGALSPDPLHRHGAFMTDRAGSSTEFLDQRPFARGDDIRHINWQAYGRTEQVTINLFQQESAPLIDLVMDCSRSMQFDPEKWRCAWLTWAFFASLSVDAGARVRGFLTIGDNWVETPWDNPDPALSKLEKDSNAAENAGIQKIPFSSRSFRIVISDLLYEVSVDEMLTSLGRLSSGFSLVAPFLVSEADPNWEGNVEFKDVEANGMESHLCDPAFMRRYQQRYRAHFASWADSIERRAGSLSRIDATLPFSEATARAFVRNGLIVAR